MSIVKKPAIKPAAPVTTAVDEKKIAQFLAGAPDASTPAAAPAAEAASSRVKTIRGKRLQITLTISPELLDLADEKAKAMGVTRAAFMSMAISKAVAA